MTTEPERKIEKLLRAYAQKRRRDAGEPPEPAPALRQQLRAEVSRRFGSEPVGHRSWLERFVAAHWGKLAIASGAAVVLVVALVWMRTPARPGSDQTELAYVKSARRDSGEAASRELVAAKSRTTAALQSGDLTLQPQSPTLRAEPAYADAQAAAADGIRAGEKFKQAKPGLETGAARGLGTGITGAQSPGEDVTLALTPSDSEPRATSAVVALRWGRIPTSDAVAKAVPDTTVVAFRNVAVQGPPDAAPGRPVSPPILNTFRIEQRGEVINVVDEDGSAYTGFVQPAEPIQLLGEGTVTNRQGAAAAAFRKSSEPGGFGGAGVAYGAGGVGAPVARQSLAVAPVQNYFFRVSGTNRALNQPVIFTGQLLVEPVPEKPEPATAAGFAGGAETRDVVGGEPRRAVVQQAQVLRVLGTAVLGHTQSITIDAVSASPH